MAIVTKSPLTGTVTDSHHGGWSAARLRWAGFDGLVFKGKAAKPTYAYVHDGVVELLDASDVWGKGVHDTVKFFREKYSEKDFTARATNSMPTQRCRSDAGSQKEEARRKQPLPAPQPHGPLR